MAFMWPGFMWFYDPFTMAALMLAYVAGYAVLLFFAAKVAPRAAARLSGRLSLYAAMLLTAGLVLVGGGLAVVGVYYAAVSAGVRLPLAAMAGFVVFANLLTYLVSPWVIRLTYRGVEDPGLQRLVDEAAARAGMRPPRALLVEGPPNAFAFGNFLAGRYVAVTRSLYEMLPEDELLAVIGHELGHHRHRDVVLIMLLGLVPSILYYMGVTLIRVGLWSGGDREERGGALYLAALGFVSVMLSFIMQVAVLAFSRLREYYADAHGAFVAGRRQMQRALARLHIYYSRSPRVAEAARGSSLRALFIYALVEAAAAPFYSPGGGWAGGGIDEVVESLKRAEVDPVQEVFSDHPPIPKRLRFLDSVEAGRLH